MDRKATYAQVDATYKQALADVGLECYIGRGTGIYTITDRVLDANPEATLTDIHAAIIADRLSGPAKKDRRNVQKIIASRKAIQAELDALAELRDEQSRKVTGYD